MTLKEKFQAYLKNDKALLLTFIPIVIIIVSIGFYKSSNEEKIAENYNEDISFPKNVDTMMMHDSKYDAIKNKEKAQKSRIDKYNNMTVSDDDFFDAMNDKVVEDEPEVSLAQIMDNEPKTSLKEIMEEPKKVSAPKVITKTIIIKEPVEIKEPEDTRRRRNIGEKSGNMGFGYSKDARNDDMIYAVIHNGNKKVKTGTHIKIRVTKDSYYQGHFIPKNTYLTAITSPELERISVKITSIKTNDGYLNCRLLAYDERDGMKGLYTPSSVNDEIANDTKESGVNQTESRINIPIVGSISTNALSKKMKDNGIPLKDGTRLVLKSEN